MISSRWPKRRLMQWWRRFNIFSTIKKIAAIFILLCLLSLFWWIWVVEGNIIILPFETPPKNDYNGQALSDLLTRELVRIKEIHQTKIEMSPKLKMENYSIPDFAPQDITLDYSLSQSGMLGQSSVSLSIGDILISLKRLLPLAKPSRTLSASLQDYGTKLVLVASLPSSQGLLTWQVSSRDNSSREEVPMLIEELAYQVAYGICDRELGSVHTWQTFAKITQGLEAYQDYLTTSNMTCLENARQMALEARNYEPTYNGSYELFIAVGSKYLLINDYERAEAIFNESIQLNPQYAKSWFGKGTVLSLQGKHDQAILAYDRAIEIDPQYISALYNKGTALDSLGKYDESIQAYDQAIQINPKHSDAWTNKGVALDCLGKYSEGIQAFDQAIEINPKDSTAWNNKGYALCELGKYNESIQALDQAIRINPKLAPAWINKGRSLIYLGKYNESIEALGETAAAHPAASRRGIQGAAA